MSVDCTFSVIIPAHNAASHIGAALDSVRDQTLTACQVIVTNDGSTDETGPVLQDYMVRWPAVPLTVVTQPNRGCGAARNAAIELATGAYVAFLDADDVWHPEKLASVQQLISDHPDADVIYHDESEISATGVRRELRRFQIRRPVYENLLFATMGANPLSPSAVVVRRSLLVALGGFSVAPAFSGTEDIDLWLRLAKQQVTFVHLPMVLGAYRRSASAMTARIDEHAENQWNVFEHHYRTNVPTLSMPQRVKRRLRARRRAANLVSRVRGHASQRQFERAWLAATDAVAVAPTYWKALAAVPWLAAKQFSTTGAHGALRSALAASAPLIRRFSEVRGGTLRCLTYHDIPPDAARNFREHVRLLSDHFRIVTLAEFEGLREQSFHASEPTLLLTFDDGFRHTTEIALEVLTPRGLSGVFFVPSGYIDCRSIEESDRYLSERFFSGRRPRAQLPPHLSPASWDQLRSLVSCGHAIGAHSVNHVRANEAEDLRHEVITSAEILESRLGVSVRAFAYPFGTPDAVNADAFALARSKYAMAFVSVRGDNRHAPREALRRHAVSATTSLASLLIEASGLLSPRHAWARCSIDALVNEARRKVSVGP